jgi:hypothetical protein
MAFRSSGSRARTPARHPDRPRTRGVIPVDPDMFKGAEAAVAVVDAQVPADLHYERSESVRAGSSTGAMPAVCSSHQCPPRPAGSVSSAAAPAPLRARR